MAPNIPVGYKRFLIKMINEEAQKGAIEMDHVIRRALAIWRLCWQDVSNGWDLLDERLKEICGENWQKDYEFRNAEIVRTSVEMPPEPTT